MAVQANPFKGSAKSSLPDGDFEIPSADSHPAVLVAIIDLGTHTAQFNGEFSDRREVALVWQLEEENSKGDPFYVAGRFTLSYHEKAGLRQALEAQRRKKYGEGDDVDLEAFLGSGWLLPITHDEKTKDGKPRTYAKLGKPGALPKATPAPKPSTKPFAWFLGCEQPVPEGEWLPRVYGQKIPDLIRTSKEMMGEKGEKPKTATAGEGGPDEDEIKF